MPALLLVMRSRAAASFGGAGRLVLGVLLESVLSTLLAPVFMLPARHRAEGAGRRVAYIV